MSFAPAPRGEKGSREEKPTSGAAKAVAAVNADLGGWRAPAVESILTKGGDTSSGGY